MQPQHHRTHKLLAAFPLPSSFRLFSVPSHLGVGTEIGTSLADGYIWADAQRREEKEEI